MIDTQEMQRRESEQRFHYYAEDFFKRWQPENHEDAIQFSSQLFSLVRQIYIDANLESRNLIVEMMRGMPMPSLFVEKK